MKPLFAIVLVVFAAGCQKPEPASGPASSSIPAGVSVDTGSAVMPLSAFSLGIAHVLPVRNTPHAVPKVQSVRAFLVSLPNVSAGDIKLYWVRDLDLIFSANQAPIDASVKQRDGSAYEITPPELSERGGYLMLVIGGANGGPSRYYAVGP